MTDVASDWSHEAVGSLSASDIRWPMLHEVTIRSPGWVLDGEEYSKACRLNRWSGLQLSLHYLMNLNAKYIPK